MSIYNNKGILYGGTHELDDPFTPLSRNGFGEMLGPTGFNGLTNEKIVPSTEENNYGSHDNSDDPNNKVDEKTSNKRRKRISKGHPSKNLEAERRRRKKLNDQLYSLRALVPNITKLDRAAILGDAINYVKELEKKVKDLQMEVEEDPSEENDAVIVRNCSDHNSMHVNAPDCENRNSLNEFDNQSFGDCANNEAEEANETVQQMEPEVEVFEIDGNELFLKVFCEHKHGGFVRLVEGLSSMGFQVRNVNAARHTCLVSSLFMLEKREGQRLHADQVRDSLLELGWNLCT